MSQETSTKSLDVSQLLSHRKQKHISARALAAAIDFVLVAAASNFLIRAVGHAADWLFLPLMVLYFSVLEACFGQTIGKRVVNLRVVNATGHLPTVGQALIRNVARAFEAFGPIGIISVVLTDKGQRVGDLLASTFVIRAHELKELADCVSAVVVNRHSSSRHVIPITPDALTLAKAKIAGAYRPEETCLSITATDSHPSGLAVQLDFLDPSDNSWLDTTDGVTISIPDSLADQCQGFQILAQDGKLVVDRLT